MPLPRSPFITLFFTHSVQILDSTGLLKNWIDLSHPVSIKEPQSPHNNFISLTLSDSYEIGSIELSSPSAYYPLTTSNADTLDSLFDVDTSSTFYEVTNYNLKISMPILELKATSSYFRFQTEYLRSYPQKSSSYVENLFWVEPIDPQEISQYEGTLLLPFDTSRTISTDSTHFQLTPLVTESLDTSVAFNFENSQYNSDQVNTTPFYVNPTHLHLTCIPYGDISVSYKSSNNSILSQFTLSPVPKYIPSSTLGRSMVLGNLEDISFGLLSLQFYRQDDILTGSLAAFVTIWGDYMSNISRSSTLSLNIDGLGPLPSILSKEQDYYLTLKESSLYSLSIFGLSLVSSIKYCQSQYIDSRLSLPEGLDILLVYHARYIAEHVDPMQGSVFYGHFLTSHEKVYDHSVAPLIYLFLTEYLSLVYDPFIHRRAARLYLFLKNLYSQDLSGFISQLPSSTQLLFIAGSLQWAYYHPSLLSDQNFLQLMSTADSILNPQESEYFPFFLYAFSRIKSQRTALTYPTDWKFSDYYSETNNSIYAPISDVANPTLKISSLGILVNEGIDFITDSLFRLYAEEALLQETLSYQAARQMWPFGYAWSSLEAELAKKGVIGQLLYAQASYSFSYALIYHLYADALDPQNAQGAALTYWFESLGQTRTFGLSDSYLKSQIPIRLSAESSTYSAVKSYLSTIYKTDDLHISQKIPKELVYRVSDTDHYTSVPLDLKNSEHIDIILKAGNSKFHSQPGFISRPNDLSKPEPFIPWTDVFPNLQVYSYTNCPFLQEESNFISSIGIGLTSSIYSSGFSDLNCKAQLFVTLPL